MYALYLFFIVMVVIIAQVFGLKVARLSTVFEGGKIKISQNTNFNTASLINVENQAEGFGEKMISKEPQGKNENDVHVLFSRRDFCLKAVGVGIGITALGTSRALPANAEMEWMPIKTFFEAPKQTTYSPRFVAYLARILLNYDVTSKAWWSDETEIVEDKKNYELPIFRKNFNEEKAQKLSEYYKEFEASVSFGLSKFQGEAGQLKFLQLLIKDLGENIAARRQIALLFSLQDAQQPVEALKSFMAETDSAHVREIEVLQGGSGYSSTSPPVVFIESPPYSNKIAMAEVVVQPTGSLLSVDLIDGGKGYTSLPRIHISPPGSPSGVAATAVAVMRGDRVDRIELRNPGSGYTASDRVKVTVEGPSLEENEMEVDAGYAARASVSMNMTVSAVTITDEGSGYTLSMPPEIRIDPPTSKKYAVPAKVKAVMSTPAGSTVPLIKHWLPKERMKTEFLELLPDNLIPTYDPCLKRFYISPVPETDPDFCITYEADQWQVLERQKVAPYFSMLDTRMMKSPVEKEKKLDAGTFLKFALGGGVSATISHMALVPLDVVKTQMQTKPEKYKTLQQTATMIWKEERSALFDGAEATFLGYLSFGLVSFGLSEFFKRYFMEIAGVELAAYYPIPLLCLASATAGIIAAVVVAPFEALRVRCVSVDKYPKSFAGCFAQVVHEEKVLELFEGLPALELVYIPYITTKFVVFDTMQQAIYGYVPELSESVSLSLGISLFSGFVAGVTAALVSQPCDSVFIKINTDEKANTIPLAFQALLKEGGVARLYKAAVPRALKSALNISIQFLMYDFVKRLLHVSPNDLEVFFDVLSGLQLDPADYKVQ